MDSVLIALSFFVIGLVFGYGLGMRAAGRAVKYIIDYARAGGVGAEAILGIVERAVGDKEQRNEPESSTH
jgi:hypothetical protein